MPSGSIEQQNGVCALGDVARYLVEVKLHGECVGDGQSLPPLSRCPYLLKPLKAGVGLFLFLTD